MSHYVFHKKINKKQFEELLNDWNQEQVLKTFYYLETKTSLILAEQGPDEIPERLDQLRLFSNEKEYVIKPAGKEYHLVALGNVGAGENAVPVTYRSERTIYLDQNITHKWKKITLVTFFSDIIGTFTMWKGVE